MGKVIRLTITEKQIQDEMETFIDKPMANRMFPDGRVLINIAITNIINRGEAEIMVEKTSGIETT